MAERWDNAVLTLFKLSVDIRTNYFSCLLGLRYSPGGEVHLALPIEICSVTCEDSELQIRHICNDDNGEGYAAEGDAINALAIITEYVEPVEVGEYRQAGMEMGVC